MWNVFPFHLYLENNQFSNRNHIASERDFGLTILEQFISILKPRKIDAIGNDAFKCSQLISQNIETFKIRHPSYGGEKEFARQLSDLYDLDDNQIKQNRLI